mmetsp:Transcript_15009/g.48989  ORF Transcript_15009/g.48989 Transcript_15009/m.48989 type:complete len:217 (+) Transcript_15009:953-1603(+)
MARGPSRFHRRLGRGHVRSARFRRDERGDLRGRVHHRVHRFGPRPRRRPERNFPREFGRHLPDVDGSHRAWRRAEGGRRGTLGRRPPRRSDGGLFGGEPPQHARPGHVAHRRDLLPLHARRPDDQGRDGTPAQSLRRVRPERRRPGPARCLQLRSRSGGRQERVARGARPSRTPGGRDRVVLRICRCDASGSWPDGLRDLGQASGVLRICGRRARR